MNNKELNESLNAKAVLDFDEYFMSMAILTSLRSKDPNSKVGAIIVSVDNKILSTGFNGFIRTCWNVNNDQIFPWSRDTSKPNKYNYVVHAEANAIANSTIINFRENTQSSDTKIYTTLFPCHTCSQLIIQCGINHVHYLSDKYKDTESCQAAREMFKYAGVHLHEFYTDKIGLQIDYKDGNHGIIHRRKEESNG